MNHEITNRSYSGMTVNERLPVSGLITEFDKVKKATLKGSRKLKNPKITFCLKSYLHPNNKTVPSDIRFINMCYSSEII